MKGKLIGYTLGVLVLLVWVGLSGAAAETSYKSCLGERPDVVGQEAVAWSEWVRSVRRKRQPSRNPWRGYRLSRQRWRRRLRYQLEQRREGEGSGGRTGPKEEGRSIAEMLLSMVVMMPAVSLEMGLSVGLSWVWWTFQSAGRWGQGGRKRVKCSAHRHYRPEFDKCLVCAGVLQTRRYLNWRKPVQMLKENVFVTSRGRYCPAHPELTYVSAAAMHLSLPKSTYGLDVLARIGYLRDQGQMSFGQIRAELPEHIRVSERHLGNLSKEYLALLSCAERLDVEELKQAAAKYGGLMLGIDGLEPEGGQPQLWVVREVLTNTILAAGWLPRVDEDTPVAALKLPWLATVSDKQVALIKALEATWDDVPHQYCQVHYLSNAVTPLYEADEHMKTQIRKRVRAGAGVTMRQSQAEAKKRKRDNKPGLIATGLAISPPDGLEAVRDAAQTARTGQNEQPASSAAVLVVSPIDRPQTAVEVQAALEGSGVEVVVRQERGQQKQSQTDSQAEPKPVTKADRQQMVDELVEAYAARLRSVLARSGRKPFRLAGLRLYADLLALQGSLENSLNHLPDEARLTCFAEAIRETLLAFEEEYTTLAEGYSWVLDISDILDKCLPEPGAEPPDKPLSATVQAELEAYLTGLEKRSDLNPTLLAFRRHLRNLTKRYAPGLFHCYDIPGLPRPNNNLESLFGRVRRQTRRTSGPDHAKQRLHEQGAWLLFDLVEDEGEQVQRLQRVPLTEWRDERQRMQAHLATFTDNRRFRRQPSTYLAQLETQAATIADLP